MKVFFQISCELVRPILDLVPGLSSCEIPDLGNSQSAMIVL
ncbi:MAG: hypothetical protein WCJ40_00550 [Planctomycetota bacterium]